MKKLSPKISLSIWTAVVILLLIIFVLMVIRLISNYPQDTGLDAIAKKQQYIVPYLRKEKPIIDAVGEDLLNAPPQEDKQSSQKKKDQDKTKKADAQTKPKSTASQEPQKDERPKIAVIIRDLGLSKATTSYALKLPPSVTVGFSPYGKGIDEWVKQAKSLGHETLLGVPMEPKNYPMEDPGPYALLTTLDLENNLNRLKWVFGRADNVDAFYSAPGEVFSNNKSLFASVLAFFHKNNQKLIFGNGISPQANKLAAKTLKVDFILDEEKTEKHIIVQLQKATERAKKEGHVVVMASPYPLSVKVINQWLSVVNAEKIAIVPVSALFKG